MTPHLSRVRTFKPRRRRLSESRRERFDALSSTWLLEEVGDELDFADIFANRAPVVLDVGIGIGESAIEMARSDPTTNIVGVDVHTPGIANTMFAAAEFGLHNLRLVHGDALGFIDRIAPATLSGVRVYFPDPWPKHRHVHRRIVDRERTAAFVHRLRPGGWLHLATDVDDYASQMQQVCCELGLEGGPIERPADRPLTRFEQRGIESGRRITDLWYRRGVPGNYS